MHAGLGWTLPPALTLPGFQLPDSGMSRAINVNTASRVHFPPSAEKVATPLLARNLQARRYGLEICLIPASVAGASRISNCQCGLGHIEMNPSTLRRPFQGTAPERRLKNQMGLVSLGADGLVALWSVLAPRKMEA